MSRVRSLILCLLVSLFTGALSVHAEGLPPALVGRISAVDGGAALRTPGGDWADSAVNDPIAAAMSVRTTAQGRAVVRLAADSVALAPDSEIDFEQLDPGGSEIALHRGRIGVRVSVAGSAHSVEIDLSQGKAWLLAPGDYEITDGGQTTPSAVAVMKGRARFVGKGLDTMIAEGVSATLSGSDPVLASTTGAAPDAFSAWWRLTGDDHASTTALHYLPPEMTGYGALDGSGSWDAVAGYGAVWFPTTVPSDWAPFRYGHWHWVAPWGWTWIDDMNWGFAPSHYGRWAIFPGPDGTPERWGWVPGRRVAHPGYMPAAVAFLGTAAVGLSYPNASGPAVAWFPLAPDEVYWPSYTHDLSAIRRLNEGVVADTSTIGAAADGAPPADIVDGDYKYRRYASVVPRPIFVGSKPVALSLVQIPEQRLDNAPLLPGSPQIGPVAPRPVVTVAASAVSTPRLANAARTLVRILRPHRRELAGRWRVPSAHLERPRVMHAVFSQAARQRQNTHLHFVALRHRR